LPLGWAATAHPFHAADPLVLPGPNETPAFVRPPQQGLPRPCCWRPPAARRTNRKIMQTSPSARHSPIGLFQRVWYLVHLARDGWISDPVDATTSTHPDRRRARWRGHRGRSTRPGGGCFSKASGQRSLTNRAPRGVGRSTRRSAWFAPSRQSHLGWQPSRFLTDRAEAERAFQLAQQLGSVNAAAAELGTTWPSRARRLPATDWTCRPATLKPSASGLSPRPASAQGSRPRRPLIREWPRRCRDRAPYFGIRGGFAGRVAWGQDAR
jgi:hypothetical protein